MEIKKKQKPLVIINIFGLFFILIGILAFVNSLSINPPEIFWICYSSLILIGIGMLTKNSYLIASQVNLLLIADLIWIADFASFFINGKTLWGITDYLFISRTTLSNVISFQHILLMPLAFYSLYKIKLKRSDMWKISTAQFVIFGILSLIFTPTEQNINCVFSPCLPLNIHYLPYLLTWTLVFFLMISLTNFLLTKIPILNEKIQ